MKIAVITDTHFGARNDSQAFADYFYNFWNNIFFPYMKENNIKEIIHCGDLMDRRKYVNFDTLSRMRREFIQPMIDNGITMHTIVGNHDTYFKNTVDVNSIEQLFDIDPALKSPVVAYSRSTTIEFDSLNIDLIPWINQENESDVLDFIDKTKSPVAFGHFDLSGFEMHKGVKSAYHSRGAEFLDKYDTVYSGHFHTKSDNGHIYYLGNTYEMTWSDYNDTRGFHIFDTETLETTFVPNTYVMHSKIIYDDNEIDTDAYDNMIVKLIVDEKKDIEYFNNIVEILQKKCESLAIIEDHGLLSTDQIEFETEDTITTLNNYVDKFLNIDNSKQVKKILREVYVEALSI